MAAIFLQGSLSRDIITDYYHYIRNYKSRLLVKLI